MNAILSAEDSGVDLTETVAVLRRIVEQLRVFGWPYSQIVKKINEYNPEPINESALRAFVDRETTRVNRSNKTLISLWNFVDREQEEFPKPLRDTIADELRLLGLQGQRRGGRYKEEKAFAGLLSDWMGMSDRSCSRIAEKFAGKYVLLRRSSETEYTVVRSSLTIERDDESPAGVFVTHEHLDRRGRPRVSKGVLLESSGNLYIILNVEQGAGMETLTLRNPIQMNFKVILGFITSMCINRTAFAARVVLLRDNGKFPEGSRFADSDPENPLRDYKDEIALLNGKQAVKVRDVPERKSAAETAPEPADQLIDAFEPA